MFFKNKTEHYKYHSIFLNQLSIELNFTSEAYNINRFLLNFFRQFKIMKLDCFKLILLFLRSEFLSFITGEFKWIKTKETKTQNKLFYGSVNLNFFEDSYYDFLLKFTTLSRTLFLEKVELENKVLSSFQISQEIFSFLVETEGIFNASNLHISHNKRFQEFCFLL